MFSSILLMSSTKWIPEQHKIKTIFTSNTKLNIVEHFYNTNNLFSIAAQNFKTSFTTL
jgi:hypothetical protein